MSIRGTFWIEDGDIVRLEPDHESIERGGWVNVGAHSIEIRLDDQGNLVVEAYACGDESAILGSLKVSRETAIAAGATDLDQ